ncbi:HNH endonuclease [Pseudomonas sp. JUb52]|uniref:HNH endonuclease n=1 Tax=Pseudomonas sp. JUb52 TaxID=2485127 RepID=UPI0021143834|nr:HNH endonuclease [Pseudomonas sp. JUb52]
MLKPRTKTLETSKTSAKPRGNTWGEGRGGRPWRRIRERILQRDLYTCQACGLVAADAEVDHIVNLAQGGGEGDENLQTLCGPCHRAKTAREAGQARG